MRPARHALSAAVRRALPRPPTPLGRRYLARLDRVLDILEGLATGSPSRGWRETLCRPASRGAARRFLASLESTWDDGDEALVRGFLDRWDRNGAGSVASVARALTDAAAELARIHARPQTLWFFLWEMESAVAGLAARGPGRR